MAPKKSTKELELFGPMYVASLESPVGKVYVECDGERITRVSFSAMGRGKGGKQPKALKEAVIQLTAYFAGRRKKFDLPLFQVGSPYRRKLWQRLVKIPFGKATTYAQLAESVGGSARSTGGACGDNPLLIVVPCHRVLAKDGLLTGYAGELWRKKWLLQHEGVIAKDLFDQSPTGILPVDPK